MKNTLLEIIQKINTQKRKQNLHPDFVTRKEIMRELIARMDIELELMVTDNIIQRGDIVNDIYFIKK